MPIIYKWIKPLLFLRVYLQISFKEIEQERTQLDRLRLLSEIGQGNLPRLRTHSLILQKNEIPHWSEPGDLLEGKVVGRRYEGGTSGVSVIKTGVLTQNLLDKIQS